MPKRSSEDKLALPASFLVGRSSSGRERTQVQKFSRGAGEADAVRAEADCQGEEAGGGGGDARERLAGRALPGRCSTSSVYARTPRGLRTLYLPVSMASPTTLR